MMQRIAASAILALACCGGLMGAEPIYKVGFKENIQYLEDGRLEKLDLYYPMDAGEGARFPAVVIIHGGGWSGGEKQQGREANIGTNLARMGYVAASIDYMLSESNRPSWPTNIQDCKKAVQWLRANAEVLHVDSSHIGCIGGSAGGHLSALLATAGPDAGLEPHAPYPGVSSSIQAAVNLYGIMDLFHWRSTAPDGTPKDFFRYGSQNRMFGKTWEEAEAMWKLASPMHQLDKGDPPVFNLHGKADSTVDYLQAVYMDARQAELGLEHELMLLDGIGHTFDLQRWGRKPLAEDVRRRIFAFYDRHLKNISPEESARRHAALLAWEKANPAEAACGGFSCKGKLGEKMDVASQGGRKEVRLSKNAKVFLQAKAGLDDLKDGMQCEIDGKRTADDAFLVQRVVFFEKGRGLPNAVGQVSGRGQWKHGADGAFMLIVNSRQSVKLDLSPGIDVFKRSPAQASTFIPGVDIVYAQGCSMGAFGILNYIVITKE